MLALWVIDITMTAREGALYVSQLLTCTIVVNSTLYLSRLNYDRPHPIV